MRNIFFVITTGLLAFFPLKSGAQSEDAIQSVISDQIAAFQVDDFSTAFGYASQSIQSIFGTPERFGQMVESGYPMVHRPGAVAFLELGDIQGDLWQRVLIHDQSGRPYVLNYQMVQQGSEWKINAVYLSQAPDIGV